MFIYLFVRPSVCLSACLAAMILTNLQWQYMLAAAMTDSYVTSTSERWQAATSELWQANGNINISDARRQNWHLMCGPDGSDKRIYGWMDRWMSGSVDGWIDGWMDWWMDGWMDGWVNGWTDGRKDELNRICHIRHMKSQNPHLSTNEIVLIKIESKHKNWR